MEPAIGNAVANALNGVRIKDLPIRPRSDVERWSHDQWKI